MSPEVAARIAVVRKAREDLAAFARRLRSDCGFFSSAGCAAAADEVDRVLADSRDRWQHAQAGRLGALEGEERAILPMARRLLAQEVVERASGSDPGAGTRLADAAKAAAKTAEQVAKAAGGVGIGALILYGLGALAVYLMARGNK